MRLNLEYSPGWAEREKDCAKSWKYMLNCQKLMVRFGGTVTDHVRCSYLSMPHTQTVTENPATNGYL